MAGGFKKIIDTLNQPIGGSTNKNDKKKYRAKRKKSKIKSNGINLEK